MKYLIPFLLATFLFVSPLHADTEVEGGAAGTSAASPILKDYSVPCQTIGSTVSPVLNLNAGNCATDTIDTGETTYTFTGQPASGKMGKITLILTNGGSQTVNWPASVDWAGGTAPTETTSGVDVIVFITVDGGTTWYGFATGLDMQ